MKESMTRNGLILAAVAIITTALIALTYTGTEDNIAHQERLKLMQTLHAVMPDALFDNDMEHDCTRVTSAQWLGSEEPKVVYRARKGTDNIGVAIETIAPDGYSGRIQLAVGVTGDGTVTGVRILKHKETPGLGDKIDIRVSDWVLSFNHQQLTEDETRWAVKKDGGQFDQFTGATITPRAVVKAVKLAVRYYQQNRDMLFNAANQCAITHPEQEA